MNLLYFTNYSFILKLKIWNLTVGIEKNKSPVVIIKYLFLKKTKKKKKKKKLPRNAYCFISWTEV